MAANVGACAVAGIGGLVKGDSPTSPTSCDLSHVTNVNNETERLMLHRTRPLHKHGVGRWPFCRPLLFGQSLSVVQSF